MLIGKVTGSLWATRKDEKLNGLKFLIVDIKNQAGQFVTNSLVAADNAGAGVGDLVLVTTGSAARISLEKENVPIDAIIVGIIDSVEEN